MSHCQFLLWNYVCDVAPNVSTVSLAMAAMALSTPDKKVSIHQKKLINKKQNLKGS